MKFEFNKRYTTIAIYAFLVLAAAILFHGVLTNLGMLSGVLSRISGLLTSFVYAFGIAYLLNPVLKYFEHRWLDRLFGERMGDKPKRGVAILLTYLFSAGVIAVFVMIVLPQLISSITGLVLKLSRYVNSADTWLPSLLQLLPDDTISTAGNVVQQYAERIMSALYSMLQTLLPWLLSVSTSFASGLLKIVVGVIISIYMLMDKERFYAGLKRLWYAFLPREKADWLLDLTADANAVFGGFINGKLLDSLIIGVICFVGMSLLNMPSAMLVSVVVGVTNIIPYFGPFIGAIPSFFIILIDNPVKSLWFLVFILILQQFDGNILGPKILGNSTGLSAFWVIFSITLFGGLYGFIGMFLGVPVFSVIYMLLLRLIQSRLAAKEMPADLDSYCAPDSPLLRSDKKPAEAVHRRGHKVRPLREREDPKEE